MRVGVRVGVGSGVRVGVGSGVRVGVGSGVRVGVGSGVRVGVGSGVRVGVGSGVRVGVGSGVRVGVGSGVRVGVGSGTAGVAEATGWTVAAGGGSSASSPSAPTAMLRTRTTAVATPTYGSHVYRAARQNMSGIVTSQTPLAAISAIRSQFGQRSGCSGLRLDTAESPPGASNPIAGSGPSASGSVTALADAGGLSSRASAKIGVSPGPKAASRMRARCASNSSSEIKPSSCRRCSSRRRSAAGLPPPEASVLIWRSSG